MSSRYYLSISQLAGLTTIPAIVRELSDDDAIVAMVDANIQREELLPSEKAFAYRMKLEAMKRQGVRTDLTLSQNEMKLRSDEVLSKQFTVAIDISYIDKEIQEWIYEYISDTGLIEKRRQGFGKVNDIVNIG